MLFASACVMCMALGLYAGKRRARGKGWPHIAAALFADIIRLASGAWRWLASQFKKGDDGLFGDDDDDYDASDVDDGGSGKSA